MSSLVVVVPCYNAEDWLQPKEIIDWLHSTADDASSSVHVRVLFVHDGSTDEATPRKINRWLNNIAYSAPSRAQPGRVRIMQSKRRLGRAEAVRQGLLEAIAWPDHFPGVDGGTPTFVGLWSEELAAAGPPVGAASLAEAFSSRPGAHMIFGQHPNTSCTECTVGMAFAPLLLGLAGQERRCTMLGNGAKFFRVTSTLRTALQSPFRVPDLFICELVARYRAVLLDGGEGAGSSAASETERQPSDLIHARVVPLVLPMPEHSSILGGARDGGAPVTTPNSVPAVKQPAVKQSEGVRTLLGLLTLRVHYIMRTWPGGKLKLELALFVVLVAACASALLAGARLIIAAAFSNGGVAAPSAAGTVSVATLREPRRWLKWILRERR